MNIKAIRSAAWIVFKVTVIFILSVTQPNPSPMGRLLRRPLWQGDHPSKEHLPLRFLLHANQVLLYQGQVS
ncbi:MAG: hypothetical protein U0905_07590 [Pirellulales bacterium]